MIKAASEKGWLEGEKVMVESLTAFKIAGADMIAYLLCQRYMARLFNAAQHRLFQKVGLMLKLQCRF